MPGVIVSHGLDAEIAVDCLIIGGGAAGLTAALAASAGGASTSFRRSGRPKEPAAQAAGLVRFDVMLTLAGVFDFGSAPVVPLWLIVLWWVFAAALYRSFAKIGQSMWLADVLGGIAVPFNYMVGAGLGAVSLHLGEMLSVAVLVAIWICLLPLLYRISHRMAPAT